MVSEKELIYLHSAHTLQMYFMSKFTISLFDRYMSRIIYFILAVFNCKGRDLDFSADIIEAYLCPVVFCNRSSEKEGIFHQLCADLSSQTLFL